MSDSQAQGRLPGRPVAIVDIGSNSVRLVAYESHSRAPTPTFNEKALCGLGKGRGDDRPSARRRRRQGARRAAAIPRSLRHDADQRRTQSGHRGRARRGQRPAVSRPRRACDRRQDRAAQRPAGGAAFGARRSQLDSQGGRSRRRSGRRIARTDRREQRRSVSDRSHPAARRAVADGSFRAIAEEGGEDRSRSARRTSSFCKAFQAAPSTRSAEPGARLRGCICGSASIR